MTANISGKTKTFSLHLTFEERSRLEVAANGVPLGAYIRTVLFGGDLNNKSPSVDRTVQRSCCAGGAWAMPPTQAH